MEHRTGLELRADGRTLIGAAMRYGDVSPSHRERWEPGSARVSPDLAPTLGHRTGRVLAYGGDVEVSDTRDALVVRARLPKTEVADLALAGVKSGRYRGWSVEFRAERERREAGVRIIERAAVPGLALVDEPSFPASTVEARQRGGSRIKGRVPTGQAIDCKCADGEASVVEFTDLAFEKVQDLQVTAISRGAESVVASTSVPESLVLSTARDGALNVALQTLDTEAGRRTAELMAAKVPVYARPVWDAKKSDWTLRDDGVAVVSRAWFAYLLVRPVPEADSEGLDPVEAREGREALARVEAAGNGRGLTRVNGSSPLGAIVEPLRGGRRKVWL